MAATGRDRARSFDGLFPLVMEMVWARRGAVPVSERAPERGSAMSEWDDKQYYWVVICKNRHFHEHQNIWFGHKILLGETDSFSSLPITLPRIRVACDSCGKEYEYSQKEILRAESDPIAGFEEHPLFRERMEL